MAWGYVALQLKVWEVYNRTDRTIRLVTDHPDAIRHPFPWMVVMIEPKKRVTINHLAYNGVFEDDGSELPKDAVLLSSGVCRGLGLEAVPPKEFVNQLVKEKNKSRH